MVLYQNRFYQTSIVGGSPFGWTGIVVRELSQIISKYVVKKLDKIKKYWSVVNYITIYM